MAHSTDGAGRVFKNRIIASKKEMNRIVTKKRNPYQSRIIIASDFAKSNATTTHAPLSYRSVSSPRQFEYHPRIPNFMLCGSTDGYLSLVTPSNSRVITKFPTG